MTKEVPPELEPLLDHLTRHGCENTDEALILALEAIKNLKLAITTKDQEITKLKAEVERLDSAVETAINALEDIWGLFRENAHDRKGQHAGSPRILNPRNCSGYRDRVRAHITELQQARSLTKPRKDS